jgi:hypothetical protein
MKRDMQRFFRPFLYLQGFGFLITFTGITLRTTAVICGKLRLIFRPSCNRASREESERKMRNIGINRNVVDGHLIPNITWCNMLCPSLCQS